MPAFFFSGLHRAPDIVSAREVGSAVKRFALGPGWLCRSRRATVDELGRMA
jgi:hypothetical protein